MRRRDFLKYLGLSPLIINSAIASQFPSIPSLFSEISKRHELELENEVGFKNIYLAGDPNTVSGKQTIQDSKTIILIGDVHYGKIESIPELDFQRLLKSGFKIEKNESWRIEQKQLKILKEKFGITFVGIEGYADEKTNLFSSEIELIQYLLSDDGYTVIGLEDSKILKKRIYDGFLYLISIKSNLKNNLMSLVYTRSGQLLDANFLENIITNNLLKIVEFGGIEALSKSSNYFNLDISVGKFQKKYLAIKKENDILQKLLNNEAQIISNMKRNNLNLDLKTLNLIEQYIITEYHNYDLWIKDPNKLHAILLGRLTEVRDKFAAKKFLDEMSKQNLQIGAIVFGKAHLSGIQKELISLTNGKVNIYVAK